MPPGPTRTCKTINIMTAERLVGYLIENNLTLAIAESSTGGLVSSMIVDIPGASGVFLDSTVCYSNESKTSRLGIPPELILKHGAVSKKVAEALAVRASIISASDIGLSVTGILGPDGGSIEKPVGTTWIAVHFRDVTRSSHFLFTGTRREIKSASSETAIEFLLNTLTV